MVKNEVSIAIPFCTDKIKEAVTSINKQTNLSKKEIIAIYDNPKNKIDSNMVKFLKKNKVRLVINKENKGLAGSYNEGIRLARYNKVFLMHEDCYPNKKDVLSNCSKKMDEGFDIVNAMTIIPVKIWEKYDFWNKILTYRYIGMESTALGKASLLHKNIIKKIGYFNERDYKTAGEDIDYAVRIRKENVRESSAPDLVIHNHWANKSSFFKVLKKEWQMGEAHGVCKRKYGFKKIGMFDIERRAVFLFLILIGAIFYWPIMILGLLPFLGIPFYQALKNFIKTGWTFGLFTYPFLGIVILFTQTFAAIKGFLTSKQSSRYYGG